MLDEAIQTEATPVAGDDARYAALAARDRRFDGLFFVGVTSTGVYCRPICPARTPRRDRCRFFEHAAQAERDGFRPCLRCRPELAPGRGDPPAPVDASEALARAVATLIDRGRMDGPGSFESVAAAVGVSARHARRAFVRTYGVTPVELAQTRRLLLAKRLLTETSLSITDIAHAAGFGSLRRFNVLMRERAGRSPSGFRRAARDGDAAHDDDRLAVRLVHRPPLAWAELLVHLRRRAIEGVETVEGSAYHRVVEIDGRAGLVSVAPADGRDELVARCSIGLVPVIARLLPRLRAVLDLDARPDVIDGHLRRDPMLADHVDRAPGLRVPGSFDGIESVARAIVGQQISVAAARTILGRLAARFGTPVNDAEARALGLAVAFPDARAIAAAAPATLGRLGVIGTRARALRSVARMIDRGELDLEPGASVPAAGRALLACPGIGPWTEQTVLMRALRWPDAFPASDLGLRLALGDRGMHPRAVLERAEPWRPWRAYAAAHLWRALD